MIKFVTHVRNDRPLDFETALNTAIETCESKGLKVEIQYQASGLPNGGVYYSALVIGRVEVNAE